MSTPEDRTPFAKEWALHIMTAVIAVLVIVLGVLIITVTDLRTEVERVRTDLTDGQVRSCVLLAQNSDYFPPSCLDADVVAIYARDLIDSLDTTGVQGDNRRALCAELERQGVRDTDCQAT